MVSTTETSSSGIDTTLDIQLNQLLVLDDENLQLRNSPHKASYMTLQLLNISTALTCCSLELILEEIVNL